jgi:hypothetical protein
VAYDISSPASVPTLLPRRSFRLLSHGPGRRIAGIRPTA